MSRSKKVGYEIKVKPSGVYFVEYYADDVRRRESCDTRDFKEAQTRARQIVAGNWKAPTAQEKAATAVIKRPMMAGEITMAQLFDRCRQTIWRKGEIRGFATAVSNARILSEMIGHELITDMNYSRLEALKAELFAKGYSPGTVDRKMNAVGSALTQATKETDADKKPWLLGKPAMPTVVTNNFKDRVVSTEEELAIFAAIDARMVKQPTRDWRRFGYLIRFLLDTGCRQGEALGLLEMSVETADNYSYALFPRYSTKNLRPREMPLSNRIVATLPYLRMNAIGGKLFPIKASTVWGMFENIRGDVGKAGFNIDDVTIHTFRHTCLTRLAKSRKVGLLDLSEWAGHSSVQITKERYIHLMREDKLPTLAVLNAISDSFGTDLAPKDGAVN